jgi:hypothetical protein
MSRFSNGAGSAGRGASASRGTGRSSDAARSTSGSRFFGRDAAAARGTSPSAAGSRSATSRPSARGAARSPGADQVPSTATARRAGQTGFVRPSSAGTTAARGRAASGRSTGAGTVPDYGYRRYGYYPRPYSSYGNCYPYGYGGYCGPYYCSPWYAGSGFYLSFSFGAGAYFGLNYYYPWYHCGSNYAFFYGAPLSYCYVPYGFYCDASPVYVTRYVYVEDTYPTTDYETVEVKPPESEPTEEQKVLEPEPAAGSPVAEKYLRDASELFRKGDYVEAAKLFRLAALSAPENAAPLFALGQSLIAIGSDAYAAKVIRKAVLMNPGLVKEPGDIVGVFKDQAEFERVMGELAKRAEESPEGSDARFLLAAERYFTGDPKAVEGFVALRAALPDDKAVELFDAAAAKRFSAAADDLPPVAPAPK